MDVVGRSSAWEPEPPRGGPAVCGRAGQACITERGITMSTKVKVYPFGALSDEYMDRILNQIMEGVNDVHWMGNDPLEELPYGGQHTAPQVKRGEDLGMVMDDRDIAKVFASREDAKARRQREDDLQKQMLRDMDRQAEQRQMAWDMICDIPALAAGACLVGALQQQSLAWAVAAVLLYLTARVSKEVRW